MLVISRKPGQKLMLNDNIVITIVDIANGQCKLAIDADKSVKIYREEIYYQIKLANLIGKDTSVNSVNNIENMVKKDISQVNTDVAVPPKETDNDTTKKSKSFVIKKDNSKKDI